MHNLLYHTSAKATVAFSITEYRHPVINKFVNYDKQINLKEIFSTQTLCSQASSAIKNLPFGKIWWMIMWITKWIRDESGLVKKEKRLVF